MATPRDETHDSIDAHTGAYLNPEKRAEYLAALMAGGAETQDPFPSEPAPPASTEQPAAAVIEPPAAAGEPSTGWPVQS